MRKLSREYGSTVFGVYLLLTALDFPFCFAAVRLLGVERVGHAEKVVLGYVKAAIPEGVKESWRRAKGRLFGATEKVDEEKGHVVVGKDSKIETYAIVQDDTGEYDHGVKKAEKENESENASIWTQLALAYAIHKSFIFIRIPLTVSVTPKVVKVLRGWGWDIGKRRPKTPKSSLRDS
ncbi:MAG: hypothetical protein Q9163_004094 [Psora crenata]